MARPAVFLDRDGVLNVVTRGDYVRHAGQFQWLPGAREAVAALTAAGWAVVVVTNQAGIGHGYYGHAELDAIHTHMRADVVESGGEITAVYACPHTAAMECDCRKPLPGMLLQAARENDLDLKRSYFIGDSETDAQAGSAAGCTVLAVASGLATEEDIRNWTTTPLSVFPSLREAAQWLLASGGIP